MDIQTAIDRISETENLTDALDDDAANDLINWGVSQVKVLIGGAKDDASAGTKVNQVMAVMRMINQFVGSCKSKTADQQAADIRSLQEAYTQAFSKIAAMDDMARRKLAADVCSMRQQQAVETLLNSL